MLFITTSGGPESLSLQLIKYYSLFSGAQCTVWQSLFSAKLYPCIEPPDQISVSSHPSHVCNSFDSKLLFYTLNWHHNFNQKTLLVWSGSNLLSVPKRLSFTEGTFAIRACHKLHFVNKGMMNQCFQRVV